MEIIMKENESKLELWQSRFDKAKAAQSEERKRFTERELLYRGVRDETTLRDDGGSETPHIYNIIAELIESQVDGSIYPVKVTAAHAGDEQKALKIEHRINAIITSLATEELIDMAERTVPVQGGVYWHIEWDNSLQTHTSHGGISISQRHPINVICFWNLARRGIISNVHSARMCQRKARKARKRGVHSARMRRPMIL